MEINEKMIAELLECDMMNNINTTNALVEFMKLKQKEQFVLSKIHSDLPQQPNFKGGTYFRKRIIQDGETFLFTSKSYKGLVDKLYDFLYEDTTDFSFQAIFYESLDYKRKTQVRSENTYNNYITDFHTFISDDFALKDITKITKTDLQEYTKQLLERKTLKEKAFLGYKGILNIVFDYAVEQQYIPTNPAKSIKKSNYVKLLDTKKKKSEEKIFSKEEIETIQQYIKKRMKQKRYDGYDPNGYAILLSILTGMRVGELVAITWDDVDWEKGMIHIHTQQIMERTPKGEPNKYYFVSWTKDERGESQNGRYFPIYQELKELLLEIQDVQKRKGIISEYIICHRDGTYLYKQTYIGALYQICNTLGFPITNNHAFRMALNSLVLIPAGFTVTERSAMLGHSVEVNLQNYSYDPRTSYEDKINKMDEYLRKIG